MPSKYGFTTKEDIENERKEQASCEVEQERLKSEEKKQNEEELSRISKEKVSPFSSRFFPDIMDIAYDYLSANSHLIVKEFNVSEIKIKESYFEGNMSSNTHHQWHCFE
jgi:hypothetical protein